MRAEPLGHDGQQGENAPSPRWSARITKQDT
jgi:hypothetical protein